MLLLQKLVCFISLLFASEAVIVDRLSFEAPFTKINAKGDRQISDSFTYGGDTVVQQHFARLTPDRQSKRGHIWSKDTLKLTDFSIITTFRISGTGDKWFGDGIGLWLTTEPTYAEGDNHGMKEFYKGIGIIFDTFENLEHPGGHFDVAVLINDGTLDLDHLQGEGKLGCQAPGLRYHEKHAAFNPAVNASRAKIMYVNNLLTVAMDTGNTGDWVECVRIRVNNLESGWANDATIGLTGTTGSLADNHDVLGLAVYNEVEDKMHLEKDEKVKSKTAETKDLYSHPEDATTDDKVAELQRQLNLMMENAEHKFTSLKENMENTISKLKKQEEEDEVRIKKLEAMVSGEVDEKFQEKVDELHEDVDQKLKSTVEKTVSESSGWKTPFFLLMVALAVIGGLMYKKYNELRKSHLL